MNNLKVIVAGFLLLLCCCVPAQAQVHSIDTVYAFLAGSGQNTGQQAPFFPANIFGFPATTASLTSPATLPDDICSLGLGGEITVGFRNGVLTDQPGVDFIVFENAFDYAFGRRYAEPAMVAVSKNGVDFIPFPFDSLSLQGCAGVQPTIATEPFNPDSCGGDRFDLATIGMDSIRFIRITDISSIVINNPSHPFWDVTISGFDLDAVIGLSVVPTPVGVIENNKHQSYIIRHKTLFPLLQDEESISIYSLQGNLLHQSFGSISNAYIFPKQGVYAIVVNSSKKVFYDIVFVED